MDRDDVGVLEEIGLRWSFFGRDSDKLPQTIYVTEAGRRRLLEAIGTECGHALSSDPARSAVRYLGMEIRVLGDDEFVIV